MFFLKNKILSTIILFLLFAPGKLLSQEKKENYLIRAIQMFDNGNFEEAEPLLKSALDKDPDDFLINYYYGACRTENNHFTTPDLECLIIASSEVTPVAINYYFGIQYHARSNWERALKFYNVYNSEANLDNDKKKELLKKIQQCYDHVNPFEQYISGDENEAQVVQPVIQSPVSGQKEKKRDNRVIKKPEKSKKNRSEPIKFLVNSEITYLQMSHFRTEKGKSSFITGTKKQKELSEILKRTDELRKKYNASTSNSDKKLLGQDIIRLEKESYLLQKEITRLLSEAQVTENDFWQKANSKEKSKFISQLDKLKDEKEKMLSVKDESLPESVLLIDPEMIMGGRKMVTTEETDKVPDLVYKIQIGAYSRGLPNYIKRLYKKLSLIRKIDNYTDDKGVVVYTTGNLTNFEDAVRMQNQVRQEGVEDAYVVPYLKGKRITLREAKELEEEK